MVAKSPTEPTSVANGLNKMLNNIWFIPDFQEVTFDDLQLRTLAQNDPALFLSNYTLPLIIDEVQYAPHIFSEIKLQVDLLKKEFPDSKVLYLVSIGGQRQKLSTYCEQIPITQLTRFLLEISEYTDVSISDIKKLKKENS